MNNEMKIEDLQNKMESIRSEIEAAYETSDKKYSREDYLYAALANHADYQMLAKEHTALMVQRFKEKRKVNA